MAAVTTSLLTVDVLVVRLGNGGEVDRQASLGGLLGRRARAGVRRSPAAAADRLSMARILGAGAEDLPGQVAPARAALCLLLCGEVERKHQTQLRLGDLVIPQEWSL
jgi:hypothetical protein